MTPFSWSRPSDVNEHVQGAAEALRARGHTVTIVAPSSRASDLLDGRRALQRGVIGDVVAIGAAVRTSRSERVGLPVGVRANLAAILALGSFDVVHGFEPGLPSLSSTALLEAETTAAATFLSTERIAVPPRKNQRAKFLARVDALLGTSEAAIERARERFPGDYDRIPLGVDTDAFSPAPKRQVIVVELAPGQSAVAKAVLRLLKSLPGWEVLLGRTVPMTRRPTIPPSVRERAHVRSLVKPDARRIVLSDAAIFVPAPGGSSRLLLRRARAAVRLPSRPASQPSPSSQRQRSGASSRTASSARRPAQRRARRRSRAASTASPSTSNRSTRVCRGAAARRRLPTRGRRPAGRSRVDRRRPAHAHVPVARLLDRPAGPDRPRRVGGPRSDRGHRSQRLRRRPRDDRARKATRPDRDPRRGGEDRQPGRGDRPLPARGDPARE